MGLRALAEPLLCDLREVIALPCASVSLSGFHLPFLLGLEAAECDQPDGTVTIQPQL